MDVYVRPGDSLWYYSQLFNIPIQLIIQSNTSVDPQALTPGQRIRIPGYISEDYVVMPGDSFWSIAEDRGLPLDTIILLNQTLQPTSLQTGMRILLPKRVTARIVDGRQNYDYETMRQDIKELQEIYPFIEVRSIGSSVLGKEIPEIQVGAGDKPIHYNGSFHANEWITTPILLTFLNDYLLSLTNQETIRGLVTAPLYEQTNLSIVPMVNPDGVDLVLNGPPTEEPYRSNIIKWNNGSVDFSDWKANIRGVDLNDQFPANWELERDRNPKTPGPRDYGGEAPLTEPEAIAIADLTREKDFVIVVPFHTQGEVIYYGFEGLEPPQSQEIAAEFSRVSGYQPIESAGSYAGYKDWFIQDWRRPGFTIELGKGTNPLPLSQFDEIYQEALGIFLAGLYI